MKLSLFKKKQTSEEKFRESLSRYQQALEHNPGELRLHIKIAELCLEYNKKDKAIEHYMAAARAYQEKRLLQIAVAIYNHIITLDPDRFDVYTELAQLHLKNGFVGDSVAVLERLAHHYHAKNMEFEAVQVLKKIKEIDPQNEFFKIKVEKFYTSKDISEEETLKTGPRGKWELVGGETGRQAAPTEGTFDLATALEEDTEVTFSISTIPPGEEDAGRQDAGAPEEIFEELKSLIAETPDQNSPMFHYNLGLAYERCRQYARAADEFQAAMPACDNKVLCAIKLAQCLAALERFDEARTALSDALRLPSLALQDKLELLYCSAHVYKEQGDTGNALKIFKKIHAADKNFKSVAAEIKKLS